MKLLGKQAPQPEIEIALGRIGLLVGCLIGGVAAPVTPDFYLFPAIHHGDLQPLVGGGGFRNKCLLLCGALGPAETMASGHPAASGPFPKGDRVKFIAILNSQHPATGLDQVGEAHPGDQGLIAQRGGSGDRLGGGEAGTPKQEAEGQQMEHQKCQVGEVHVCWLVGCGRIGAGGDRESCRGAHHRSARYSVCGHDVLYKADLSDAVMSLSSGSTEPVQAGQTGADSTWRPSWSMGKGNRRSQTTWHPRP